MFCTSMKTPTRRFDTSNIVEKYTTLRAAWRVGSGWLFFQTQCFNKVGVRFGVFALKVFEQATTFGDLFDETAPRAEILAVRAKVLGELLHFGGQNGDLDLGRTGIRF